MQLRGGNLASRWNTNPKGGSGPVAARKPARSITLLQRFAEQDQLPSFRYPPETPISIDPSHVKFLDPHIQNRPEKPTTPNCQPP